MRHAAFVRFLVGGQYACMRCMRRGIRSCCPRCDTDEFVADLATEHGRSQLAMRRAGELGERRIRAALSRETFGRLREETSLQTKGARIAFVVGVLAGLHTLAPGHDVLSALARVAGVGVFGLAAIAAWLVFLLLAGLVVIGLAGVLSQAFWLAASVCRSLGRSGSGFVPTLARAAERWCASLARSDLLARTIDRVDGWHAPRVRDVVTPPDVMRSERRVGTLMSGRDPVITFYRDRASAIDVREALARPFHVTMSDGAVLEVEIDRGVIECKGLTFRAVEPNDAVPSWATAFARETRPAEIAQLPAGTRVAIRGGEIEDRLDEANSNGDFRSAPLRKVLRGTADAPLHIDVLDIPPHRSGDTHRQRVAVSTGEPSDHDSPADRTTDAAPNLSATRHRHDRERS